MDLVDRYGGLIDDIEAFRAAIQRPLPTVVRHNPIKSTIDQTLAGLREEGIDVNQREWNARTLELAVEKPGRNWAYYQGWIHGQEEISQVPATMLDVERGDTVFDVAAAPGGKATQLAALVRGDGGCVVANDVNLGRLAALRSNADRLGVDNLIVTNQNARTYSTKHIDVEMFDAALVDAPCTGEGTVRKNPDAGTVATVDERTETARIQCDILERAIELTKPGGTVVYSTCTLAPEENEGVLSRVLDETDTRVEPVDVGLHSVPGVSRWEATAYHPHVENAHRFYPHLNDTGGFFCAKLRVNR